MATRIIGGAGTGEVVAKTADYTVVAADYGKRFTTRGAGSAVNFTLPALSAVGAGWWCEFFNEADQNMTVTAADVDTEVVINDLAADSISFQTASEKIGASCRLSVNDNASKWLVQEMNNEIATATIAT